MKPPLLAAGVLIMVLAQACGPAPGAPKSLENGTPGTERATAAALNDAAGTELQGMFRYLADAAVFRDCRTNKVFPVSMEGAYLELERAYLNSGIEPGQELMVQLRGRYLERPSMEGNNHKVKLIVDILENIHPQDTCTPTHHAELLNTYWKLVELNRQAITVPDGMKDAHMILAGSEQRVHGHAGCNNFFGGYEESEGKLSFSTLGSTRMACPPRAMDTEQAFLAALAAATRYEIIGQFLDLYAENQLLARFEAVYL